VFIFSLLRAICVPAGFLLAMSAGSAIAATVVVPFSSAATEGNNNSVVPYNTGARTNQYQMTNAAMGGLPVGAVISGIQFRLDGGGAAAPAASISWSDYEITLSQAANAIGSMSNTLASNMQNPVKVVDGSYTLAGNSLPGTGTPRTFGAILPFAVNYTYQGGDLVLLLTHTNSTGAGTTPTLDAIQTDTSGTGGIRALSTPVGFQSPTADNNAFRFPVFQLVYMVPEPASFSLLAITGASMLLYRRRAGVRN
jgi:hypothetical protein